MKALIIHSRLTLIAVLLSAVCLGAGCDDPVTLREIQTSRAFVDITRTRLSPEPLAAGWSGLALFDYDNDGDIDLFVTSIRGLPNLLYQNDGQGNFEEVANRAGIRFTSDSGVCTGVGDFDGDGWLDLIVGRQFHQEGDSSVNIRYLKNLGPNSAGVIRFADATEETGLAGIDFVSSVGVADFDNDGRLDLYLGRYDMRNLDFPLESHLEDTPNVMLKNTGVVEPGVPVFEDITAASGTAGSQITGLAPETSELLHRMPTWAVYPTDVNNDGYMDIFSLQELPGGVDLFINNGDATFAPQQQDLLNARGGWMGAAGADYDRDGDLDYFLTNVGANALGDPLPHVTSAWARDDGTPFHRLLSNDGDGKLTDVADSVEVAPGLLPPDNRLGGSGLQAYEFGFSCAWLDIQNDGFPDLTWTGDIVLFDQLGEGRLRQDFHGVSRMLANAGEGEFQDVTGISGLFYWDNALPLDYGYSLSGRALAAIDINNDGYADICRTANESLDGLQVLQNPAVTPGRWLTVRLRSDNGNTFGIGARITVRHEGEVWVAEVLTTVGAFTAVHPQVHFGLGSRERVEEVSVRWPTGETTILNDVATDQILTIHLE
ncbi:MAG: CRTAC1 family protein [Phycisphaerae bacterium]